jgi:DNA-binding transcriptional ArsR family regulator
LAKALADRSRLVILAALAAGPLCNEEIAGMLGLAPSTVSFHLKKLVDANLVTSSRDQYYTVYRLAPATLELTLAELVRIEQPALADRSDRLRLDAERVLATFFADGRLTKMPAQKRKREVVLDQFAALFEPGDVYPEALVNEMITAAFEDYCLIRRLLVDEGYLARERGMYSRTSKPPSSALRNPITETSAGRPNGEKRMKNESKTLREGYKLRETTAGIFRVVNNVTGTVFLGSALNLHGPLNRIEFGLNVGSFENQRMQEDFRRYGRENFTFEVVERIEPSQDPDFDVERELTKLEERYAATLDRRNTYNEKEDIRFMPRRRG